MLDEDALACRAAAGSGEAALALQVCRATNTEPQALETLRSAPVGLQGDEIRVSSKKRDDLQAVIALLKGADLDIALQFVNYR